MKNFILDVDGVLTTGQFLYNIEGKAYKIFGPDDSDALKSLSRFMNILFISADTRGFPISERRVVDMGFEIHLVSSKERINWIDEHYDVNETVYMGDGFYDPIVFEKIAYGIAPSNASKRTRDLATFVTERRGGDRAISEACLHLFEKYFPNEDPFS